LGRLVPNTLLLAVLMPSGSCTDVRRVGTVGERPIQVLVWNNALTYGHASRVNAIPILMAREDTDNIHFDFTHAHTEVTAEGTVDDPTFDASVFTDANLDEYDVVFFLHTTGTTIDDDLKDVRRQALRDFIEKKGRGFVGTHSATDTYQGGTWPWYVDFIGANYTTMKPLGGYLPGTLRTDQSHPILTAANTPDPWNRSDEWFVFNRDPIPGVTVLMTATDQQTSTARPSVWVHEIPVTSPASGSGRMFYTACCHDSATLSESKVIDLIVAGIKWAAHRL
jgi:type 1 glutamine amidotransferase